MNVNDIRSAFLDFFAKNQHTVVSSGSLLPTNDDTLLFTNAGMVPFKDVFLGRDKRAYTRATTAQLCIRAGGKHNDLENVGYTARHHTFFEMLGNFSFGDYFKREAINLAWKFLTEELKLPVEKLWITIFEDDDEAANIWLNEIGISKDRFSRCGAKDNFWSMGDTGPCGPCSEIFYDHGPSVFGGPPGSKDADGDRYIEIWNLVFMQFNRDGSGNLQPLPKPSIDTGMGLERLAAVLQGVHSNYEIDLFSNLINDISSLLSCSDKHNKSLRVIADHIRSACFLITEGIIPSNEGRGYVLRRIIRRALRHGYQLGVKQPFFYKIVASLVQQMGKAYQVLSRQQARIEQVLLQEEQKFSETLVQGMIVFEQSINDLSNSVDNNIITGEIVFKLYDTYGFPVDLTVDLAREHNLAVDIVGFEKCMEEQRQRARNASQFGSAYHDYSKNLKIDSKTEFVGYCDHENSSDLSIDVIIEHLFVDGKSVDKLLPNIEAMIVLPKTMFYAESGGQVGDTGVIKTNTGEFVVKDTQKLSEAIVHIGVAVSGSITVGQNATVMVNKELRQATRKNHSATHLLHAALREILGEHVSQKGSLVSPEKLRFDFTHNQAINESALEKIQARVNEKILDNSLVETLIMPIDEAKKLGAMALFSEKYGEKVRVLRMAGGYSVELCGGTHVSRTGDIGLFIITMESGVASGVRRIEALTGKAALYKLNTAQATLNKVCDLVRSDVENVTNKITQLLDKQKNQEKEISQLKQKLVMGSGSSVNQDLQQDIIDLHGIRLLIKKIDNIDAKLAKDMVDDLKNKIYSGVVVLAGVNEGKVQLTVGVTKDCTSKISAGELVSHLASMVGGKGGGRADLAQAGGTQPNNLDNSLSLIKNWILERII